MLIRCCVIVCVMFATHCHSFAANANQQSSESGGATRGKEAGALPVAAPGDQVVIKREPVVRIDPQKYRVTLSLAPHRAVTTVAPHDGIVRGLPVKVGQALQDQAEVARLDNAVQKLRLQRAQNLLKVATLEQKLAADKSNDARELFQAKVDAAKADVDLAQLQFDLATVRAPFAGEVLRILAREGQYLHAGEPVALIGDTTQLQVEVPADKAGLKTGEPFPLKVDGADVHGQIEEILPLASRFDPLRELFDSVVSVIVIVDNPGGQIRPGQTVYVPLIPRQPVAEVPALAVGNLPNGQRKVQVLRELVVRDLPITLMGSVGVERVFVSGPFADGDEVIYETSHLLADGFPLKPGGGGKSPDAKKVNSKTNQPTPSF